MDLLSGYSDNALAGFNGYTPQANAAIANNNSDYYRNQAAMALLGQQQIDRNTAAIAATGPSSGYGTVGGYPTFGGAQDLTGRSSFSGVPLGGGGTPSGSVERGADLPDLSQNPFDSPQVQADKAAFEALNGYKYGGDPYGHMGYFGAPAEDLDRYFSTVAAPFAGGGGSAPSQYNPNMAGDGTAPSIPDYSRLGYTPDASASQNGFGYPGGGASQMFDPSIYGAQGFNSYGQPGVGGGGMGDPFAGQNSGYVPEWLRAYRQNFGSEPDGSPLIGGLKASGGDPASPGVNAFNSNLTYPAPMDTYAGTPWQDRFNAFGTSSGNIGGNDPYAGLPGWGVPQQRAPMNDTAYDRLAGYGDSGTVLPWSGSNLKMPNGFTFSDTPNGRADAEAFYRNNGQQGVTDPMGYNISQPGAIGGTGGEYPAASPMVPSGSQSASGYDALRQAMNAQMWNTGAGSVNTAGQGGGWQSPGATSRGPSVLYPAPTDPYGNPLQTQTSPFPYSYNPLTDGGA